jgi:hypothetical protein
MDPLQDFRAEKDRFFSESNHSPLTREQKEAFGGLNYFDDNPELRLEVDIKPFESHDEILMQTSTGEAQSFRRYGKFSFEVQGEHAELTFYANRHGFFLPFIDSLAGKETYPAGRYLEPEVLPNGRFRVDFNLAYNPYCAYNDQWSCPLPPAENRLKVPIRAGEKLPDPSWTAHEGYTG